MVHIWCMYSTSSLQGVWHHIHGSLHQKYQRKVQFDQYVTINIGVLFPYMASLCNAVATGYNQSSYKSQRGGNLQLQSSCDQLQSSPVASLSEKLQLDFKTLETRVGCELTIMHSEHNRWEAAVAIPQHWYPSCPDCCQWAWACVVGLMPSVLCCWQADVSLSQCGPCATCLNLICNCALVCKYQLLWFT